jgi:electron transport complex protein RnfA
MFFSAFSVNLTLQCALGVKGVCESRNPGHHSNVIRGGIIFVSTILLWVVFSKIIASVISGIYIYVLLFPVSYMVYDGFESLTFHKLFKLDSQKHNSITFPGGITAAAAFICLTVANNFLEALLISFGSAAGVFLVFMIVGEIRRRAVLEAVPKFLRGKPLVLVSMGLLSLIFSVSSILLFGMIGAR